MVNTHRAATPAGAGAGTAEGPGPGPGPGAAPAGKRAVTRATPMQTCECPSRSWDVRLVPRHYDTPVRHSHVRQNMRNIACSVPRSADGAGACTLERSLEDIYISSSPCRFHLLGLGFTVPVPVPIRNPFVGDCCSPRAVLDRKKWHLEYSVSPSILPILPNLVVFLRPTTFTCVSVYPFRRRCRSLREESKGCGREMNFHDSQSTVPPTAGSSIAWSVQDEEEVRVCMRPSAASVTFSGE